MTNEIIIPIRLIKIQNNKKHQLSNKVVNKSFWISVYLKILKAKSKNKWNNKPGSIILIRNGNVLPSPVFKTYGWRFKQKIKYNRKNCSGKGYKKYFSIKDYSDIQSSENYKNPVKAYYKRNTGDFKTQNISVWVISEYNSCFHSCYFKNKSHWIWQQKK